MKNYKTMYINPVNRISVQGRHKQVYTILGEDNTSIPTKTMNKNKEFGVGSSYKFPYDPEKKRLITGLDEVIYNEFKGMNPEEVIRKYNLPNTWRELIPKIVKEDKITKQTLFEILDKVDPDYYNSNVNYSIFDRNSIKMIGEYSPTFLQLFSLILYDHANYFDDSTPRGRMAMQLCKVHSKIANSKADVNTSIHEFYISEENESEIETESRQALINKSIYHLVDLVEKNDPFKAYQVAIVLKDYQGVPLIKGNVSPQKVREKLNAYIHNSGKHQYDNAHRFIDLVSMLKDKDSAPKFKITYMIQQALNEGIISSRDGYYIWHSKSDVDNVYKFNALDKMINFLIQELRTYNPKENDITNYYKDLMEELSLRGIKLEV
jgi:hypothetical protein